GGAERDGHLRPVEVLGIEGGQLQAARQPPGGGDDELGEAAGGGAGEGLGIEAALLAEDGGGEARVDAAPAAFRRQRLAVGQGVEELLVGGRLHRQRHQGGGAQPHRLRQRHRPAGLARARQARGGRGGARGGGGGGGAR